MDPARRLRPPPPDGRAGEIAPEVRPILKQHYPDDQATGFAPGDLRGAISVRVTVREPCAP